jgi:hypothetical protein
LQFVAFRPAGDGGLKNLQGGMVMTTRPEHPKRADALFSAFALAMLLWIGGYRYGWQSFHHDIPRDKLRIDVADAASSAATLGLVLDQFGQDRLPAGYVRTLGANLEDELAEEWSHTLERGADGEAGPVLDGYRVALASFDSLAGAVAAPDFRREAVDSVRARAAAMDSTLRALERRL